MKHFTALQTAKIFGVSTRTLERWRSSGQFVPDAKTVGGHSRYSEKQIEEFLGKKTEEKSASENLKDLLD